MMDLGYTTTSLGMMLSFTLRHDKILRTGGFNRLMEAIFTYKFGLSIAPRIMITTTRWSALLCGTDGPWPGKASVLRPRLLEPSLLKLSAGRRESMKPSMRFWSRSGVALKIYAIGKSGRLQKLGTRPQ